MSKCTSVQRQRNVQRQQRVHARLLGEAHVEGGDGQNQRGQQADLVIIVGQAPAQQVDDGDGQRAKQGGERPHSGRIVTQGHPQVEQCVVKRRVLVNVDQPTEYLSHGLPAEPDAERFVEP